MLIAIIADTHLPRGRRRLPGSCVARLKGADLIVHAGDFSTLVALEEVRTYGEVVGVHGNVDDREVRAALPQTATFGATGATIAVVHDAGPRVGRLNRMRRRFPEADAVIFGHSHLPLHERAEDGFQIFNPGSPTDRRRAPHHTMGLARVRDGSIDFELVNLD
jgi:putative phosphoesterase